MRDLRRSAGVPPTEDSCRDYKEEGGTPWCTPRVIDRAEACESDSGLGVVASEPPIPHISAGYSRWILTGAITTIHARIAIEPSSDNNFEKLQIHLRYYKFVINPLRGETWSLFRKNRFYIHTHRCVKISFLKSSTNED